MDFVDNMRVLGMDLRESWLRETKWNSNGIVSNSNGTSRKNIGNEKNGVGMAK